MQALLRGRPGREGAIVGLCFSFPGARPLSGPWELTKLPPTTAVQPPPARPWGQARRAPGLLKGQVRGGNEVSSTWGWGACRLELAGRANRQMGAGVRVGSRSAQRWLRQQGCESWDRKNV